MTNAEAIEILRANRPDACYEQLREAVDKAIDALKKQIPMKPKKIDHWRLCPTCYEKNGFSYDYLVGMKQRGCEDISYCLGCGQAIDWEGES